MLLGGQSGEHEVSLVSARSVIGGLDPAKYSVVRIGIAKDGRWVAGGDAMRQLEALADPKLLPGGGGRSRPTAGSRRTRRWQLARRRC